MDERVPLPTVKSSDRTLQVLDHLASAGSPCSLSELSAALRIPKSSLHAILHTMQLRNWLQTDATGTRFGLGVRALLVGTAYVEADSMVTLTAPTLDHLAAATGETIHLARLDGHDIVYLAKRESPHPLRLFSAIGRRLPAHTTGVGKAILAWQDDPLSHVPDSLIALTGDTITDRDALATDLRRARERGFAIDDEESTRGVRCFAIPLRQDAGVNNAVSCSVPIARLDPGIERAVIDVLLRAQAEIEHRLRGGGD